MHRALTISSQTNQGVLDTNFIRIALRFSYEIHSNYHKEVKKPPKSHTPHRYSFQGQESDNEIKGVGNSVNYKYRMHDPRIGRFFAVDPLAPKYPFYSPYHFSSNQPIHAAEFEGMESRNDLSISGLGDISEENAQIVKNQINTYAGKPMAILYVGLLDIFLTKGYLTKMAISLSLADMVEYTGKAERAREKGDMEAYEEYSKKAGQSATEVIVAVGAKEVAKALVQVKTNIKAKLAAEKVTKSSVDDKLNRYLLNMEHAKGKDKAIWFKKALGFTKDNADDLAKQIVFDASKAVKTGSNAQGDLFKQMIKIKGANGKVIETQFNWIKHKNGDVKLVGAIPTKPKK